MTTDITPVKIPTPPEQPEINNIYKLIFAMRRASNDIKYGLGETLKYELSPFPKSTQTQQFEAQRNIMVKVADTLPAFLEYADQISYELVQEIKAIRNKFRTDLIEGN